MKAKINNIEFECECVKVSISDPITQLAKMMNPEYTGGNEFITKGEIKMALKNVEIIAIERSMDYILYIRDGETRVEISFDIDKNYRAAFDYLLNLFDKIKESSLSEVN